MSDNVRDRLRTLAQITKDYPATLATHILDEFVVIPKSDLPEVVRIIRRAVPDEIRVGNNYRTLNKEFYDYGAEEARETGLQLLALANWHDVNPPVDEAQVEALAKALAADRADDTGVSWLDMADKARRLVRAGVRVEARP